MYDEDDIYDDDDDDDDDAQVRERPHSNPQ